jgi:hypothetical protein
MTALLANVLMWGVIGAVWAAASVVAGVAMGKYLRRRSP